jgi:thiol-disulfide isomerase/thioredoxin
MRWLLLPLKRENKSNYSICNKPTHIHAFMYVCHMKYIGLILVCLSLTAAKENPNKRVSMNDFFNQHTWLQEAVFSYVPDIEYFDMIEMKPRQKWLVFAGDWCSDTRELFPAFFVLAMNKGWLLEEMDLYLLGMDKKSTLAKKYRVTSLPTFILLENGKEIGRVVEQVDVSLEHAFSAFMKREVSTEQSHEPMQVLETPVEE